MIKVNDIELEKLRIQLQNQLTVTDLEKAHDIVKEILRVNTVIDRKDRNQWLDRIAVKVAELDRRRNEFKKMWQ